MSAPATPADRVSDDVVSEEETTCGLLVGFFGRNRIAPTFVVPLADDFFLFEGGSSVPAEPTALAELAA